MISESLGRRVRIAILGGGPAGLALAVRLLRRRDLNADVVVFEKNARVGGLDASFECEGLVFDLGSHRFHRAASPEILQDLMHLLGSDFLDQPRNGRIRLLGHYVKFPLRSADLLLNLPKRFVGGWGADMIAKAMRPRRSSTGVSFADVLLDSLGETMCRDFYFTYARKLWGLSPEALSPVQARRRVSANNPVKLVQKFLGKVPGFKSRGADRFYYPRKGFGQISQALAREVGRLGGSIRLGVEPRELHLRDGRMDSIVWSATLSGGVSSASSSGVERVDFVFSTIPITTTARLIRPVLGQDICTACEQLRYRAMVLHYLILKTPQFTPYDAHYFPGEDVVFTRVSEPKNYSMAREPAQMTGLCSEIPCDVGDDLWRASDEEITERVIRDLARSGLPVKCPVQAGLVRRLSHVYPVYDLDFEKHFQKVDQYLDGLPGLVSLGRQALFAHDNTHHTIEMAYRASECLHPGLQWKAGLWQTYRKSFDAHVVED